MSRFFPFVVVCSMLFWMTVCCKRKECVSSEQTALVSFEGFSPAELDTVTILRYATDTSSNALDSLMGDGQNGLVIGNFSANYTGEFYAYAYRVVVPALGRVYSVSGFEIATHICETCTFLDKPDEARTLAAYRLNGQRTEGDFVQIKR